MSTIEELQTIEESIKIEIGSLKTKAEKKSGLNDIKFSIDTEESNITFEDFNEEDFHSDILKPCVNAEAMRKRALIKTDKQTPEEIPPVDLEKKALLEIEAENLQEMLNHINAYSKVLTPDLLEKKLILKAAFEQTNITNYKTIINGMINSIDNLVDGEVLSLKNEVFYEFIKERTTILNDETAFKFRNANEISNGPIDWVINRYIPNNSLGVIFGKSGHCKSYVLYDMAYCILNGIPYAGRFTKKMPVYLICGEGINDINDRFIALDKKYNIKGEHPMVSTVAGNLLDIDEAQSIGNIIRELSPDSAFIGIDTLNNNFGSGNENSTQDMTTFLNNIKKYIKGLTKTVAIVHHTGLDKSSQDRARGNSALFASLDFEFKVEMIGDSTVQVINTKQKSGVKQPINTFQTCLVSLDRVGNDGEAEFNQYLNLKDKADIKIIEEVKFNKHEQIISDELNELLADKGINSDGLIKDNFVLDYDQRIISYDELFESSMNKIKVAGDRNKKKRFNDAFNSLIEREIIGLSNGYVWSNNHTNVIKISTNNEPFSLVKETFKVDTAGWKI